MISKKNNLIGMLCLVVLSLLQGVVWSGTCLADSSSHVDFSRTAQEVIPGLYLGPITVAKDLKTLVKLNIKGIVTVMEQPLADEEKNDDVEYFHIKLKDNNSDGLPEDFSDLVAFVAAIHAEGGKVLVHCSSGISRSASVVMAYLITAHRRSLAEAFDMVARARPVVVPNDHLFRGLQALEIKAARVHGISRDKSSMDRTQYQIYSLRAYTGGIHSLQKCREALAEADGDLDMAAMSLFGV